MSKLKHTPGPWEIFTRGRYDLSGERTSWAGGICNRELKKDICIIECGNKDENYEEEKANAQLISAAPDLLEACKKALSMINHLGCLQGCDGSGVIQLSEDEVEQCQWCDEKDRITKAIAKAEGESK